MIHLIGTPKQDYEVICPENLILEVLVKVRVKDEHNQDCSSEVDDVEELAAAATKHLEFLEQKNYAECSFIIYRERKDSGETVTNTEPFPLYLPPARFQLKL